MIEGRKVAIAIRCQLLTGSYDGSSRSCGCCYPHNCHLTAQEREEAAELEAVKAAAARNLEEYNALTTEGVSDAT